ncbi:LINE-1 retrotransposable element ORF2 protein, partial [Bienertia sinuspersici]
MIYAFNGAQDRKTLWESLREIKMQIQGPWIIIGDFNCPLTDNDRIGSPIMHAELEEFAQCMSDCDLIDLIYSGCRYTWSNNQQDSDRVMSKIDRCLINSEWMDMAPNSMVHYPAVNCSDHSPGVISLDQVASTGNKPFMFYDMWCKHENFTEKVKEAWIFQGKGTPMYVVVQKQKRVKQSMKILNKLCYSQIEERYHEAQKQLLKVKVDIQTDPSDCHLIQKEKEAVNQFKSMKEAYEKFMYQRAKVLWLKEGDSNTRFFYRSIKKRKFQQRILEIKDRNG